MYDTCLKYKHAGIPLEAGVCIDDNDFGVACSVLADAARLDNVS